MKPQEDPAGPKESLAPRPLPAVAERIMAANGCVRITPQPGELKDFLPVMDSTLRSPFQKHGVPFQINISPDVPPVTVDSGRFKEILGALLLNAAEAFAFRLSIPVA